MKNNVKNWNDCDEEHNHEQDEIKVVGAGSAEYSLHRNVTGTHRPRTDVHYDSQLDHVDKRQQGTEKSANL